MGSNEIPVSPLERVIALAEDMADGAQTYGAAIGLLQNTEAAIQADLSAANAAEGTFQTARGMKSTKATALQVADSNAKAFLAAYKKVLSITLGDAWSAAWIPAGFPGPSLGMPVGSADRLGFLPATEAFLTANPGLENADLGVTAVQATARRGALSTARSAVNDANAAAGLKKVGGGGRAAPAHDRAGAGARATDRWR